MTLARTDSKARLNVKTRSEIVSFIIVILESHSCTYVFDEKKLGFEIWFDLCLSWGLDAGNKSKQVSKVVEAGRPAINLDQIHLPP